MPEHAVIVHVPLQGGDMGSPDEVRRLFVLEEQLEKAIRAAKVGEFDGNEFGGNECVFYMYGPDADTLFAAIQPVIAAVTPPRGAYAIKRYGSSDDPGAREERVELAG